MSSPFIVIDEITTKMNEINSSLTTKIDTISSNTAVNNTASSTGTLSQKLTHLCQQLGTSSDSASSGTTSGGTAMSKLNAILSKLSSGVTADNVYAGYGTDITLASLSSAKTFSGSNFTNILTFTAPFDGEYRIDCSGIVINSHSSTGNSTSYAATLYLALIPFGGSTQEHSSSGDVLPSPLDEYGEQIASAYIYKNNGYTPANGSTTVTFSGIRVYLRGGMSYSIASHPPGYDNLSAKMNSMTVKYKKV